MRQPSLRLFPNVVVLRSLVQGPDASGDSGSRSWAPGTALAASIQPGAAERAVLHERECAVLPYLVNFIGPPEDTSAGARPDYTDASGVAHAPAATGDRVEWTPEDDPSGYVRVASVAGPASPKAGHPGVWTLRCEEIR